MGCGNVGRFVVLLGVLCGVVPGDALALVPSVWEGCTTGTWCRNGVCANDPLEALKLAVGGSWANGPHYECGNSFPDGNPVNGSTITYSNIDTCGFNKFTATMTAECAPPVDCSSAVGVVKWYSDSDGNAPGKVCTEGCEYLASASVTVGSIWSGWYTGSGNECDAGTGNYSPLPDPENKPEDCQNPQFPNKLTIQGSTLFYCMPAAGSPLEQQGCYEDGGTVVCKDPEKLACQVFADAGSVCPDDLQNCVFSGGRIVCPALQPPPETAPPEGQTCVNVGSERLCFDSNGGVTTETTVQNNPDGSTTTTTTTGSNIAGSGSSTTTTTVNPDGSSSQTTIINGTQVDQDGDGIPDGVGGGSASGGASCDAPPVCTGDEIGCATLVQQWQTRCAVAELVGDADGIDPEVTDYSGELGEALTEHGLWQEETGIFEDLGISLVDPNASPGGCPAGPSFALGLVGNVSVPGDLLCTFLDIIRPVVLAVNVLFIFVWLIRVAAV